MICAVTGHRVLGREFRRAVLEEKLDFLIARGADIFLCGMALGFDLLCGELLAERKKSVPLRLVACIPCADQSGAFPPAAKRRYDALLGSCDERVVLHERYETGCMFERNRYMVDRCDLLFAYLREGSKKGGTYYTVRYAERQKKPVFYL